MRNSENRILDKSVYIEKHHIFPKSIFGKDSSTIVLTAKEHFIAHFLLWKICKQRYGVNHYRTKKMHFAFNQMTWDSVNHQRHHTRSFEYARMASKVYNTGENNPTKKLETRLKISRSKTGKKRLDMVGKAYMGASPETIAIGIARMAKSKTGMKIENYPKNRKSKPCSEDTKSRISKARLNSKHRYINMSQEEFDNWLSQQSPRGPKGRKNSNITRAINWRKEHGNSIISSD